MKIDQLPPEMLMKIFSYLSRYGEVLLVNKVFLSIAFRVNNAKICLRIDRRFFEHYCCNNLTNSQRQQSVQPVKRQISNVEIVGSLENSLQNYFLMNGNHHKVVPVVQALSATIKSLNFTNVRMELSTFMEILSFTPSIQHLDLRNLRLQRSSGITDQSCNKQLCGDDLNLKRLESLSIETLDDDIFELLIRLPVGILTELRISSFEWNKLTAILNRQMNIKKLKLKFLTDKAIVTDIFDKLKLESLELDALKKCNIMIAAILSKQPILKSLILSEIVVNERVVNNVADLSELEILTINVTNIPVTSFENIRKLKKLKDLELQFSDRASTSGADILKTLAQSDNASLVKLCLVGFNYSTYDIISTKSVDHIAALAKSAPHLKKFKISRTFFLCTTKINLIKECFNFVQVLEIPFWNEPSIDQRNYFNPNLREMTIFFGVEDLHDKPFHKFSDAFPNLRKLTLINDAEIIHELIYFDIIRLLDEFTKLDSLIIRANHLNPSAEKYLKKHKANLKFFSLGYQSAFTLTDDLVHNLRKDFGAINVDSFGCLNMAVDQYTMNCEQELCVNSDYF